MSNTHRVIEICDLGLSSDPLLVNPRDTVQWSVPSTSAPLTGATITFTDTGKDGPFTDPPSGVGGTGNISHNGTTPTYTVADELGTYPYQVVSLIQGATYKTINSTVKVTNENTEGVPLGSVEIPG